LMWWAIVRTGTSGYSIPFTGQLYLTGFEFIQWDEQQESDIENSKLSGTPIFITFHLETYHFWRTRWDKLNFQGKLVIIQTPRAHTYSTCLKGNTTIR
jgi:hypothetical protein